MSEREVLGFGVFELDVKSGELRKQGRRVRLADQPFQVLRLLVDHPGDVVTRDELQKALWSSDTFVDFDTGLSSAVRKVRDALGDSADNPTFIETIPKRGYRFIAPIAPRNGNSQSHQPSAISHPAPPMTRSFALGIAAAVTLLAVVAAAVIYARAARPSTAPSLTAIAVLPFENLTGDKEQAFIVDGFTDGVTTNLAQNRRLQVTSRAAAVRYRGTQKPAPQIGRELAVDTIVLGSVVRTGDRLRISAQVIDAATDRHIWAHNFDGTLDDMIKLQDTVAADIVRALGVDSRSMAAQALARRPVDRQAYFDYLRAVSAEGRGGYEGFRNAIPMLESAIARQPDFALAYAELAYAQAQLLYTSPLAPRDIAPKAEEAARKAIALDETLARPHRVLGTVLHDYYWKFAEARQENQRALALEPDAAESAVNEVNKLLRAGNYDDALVAADRATQHNPASNAAINIAVAFRDARQYDRAIAILRKAIEADPRGARTHFQLAMTYLSMGNMEDAIGELELAVNRVPNNARFLAYLGWAYAKSGRPAEARRILADLEARAHAQYVSAFGPAMIHDALGEKQAALAGIERAYEDHAVEIATIRSYPPFETLKGEPRFEEIVRAVSSR